MGRKAKPQKPANTPAAVANIEDALRLIQEAQNTLDRASQKLSPICFAADLCTATQAARERVRSLWYRVDRISRDRRGMFLDSEPTPTGGQS